MSTKRVPFRDGHLEGGTVAGLVPVRVRHEGSATVMGVQRAWPSARKVSLGEPCILYHSGDGGLPELWSMRYAQQVRTGEVAHPRRSPGVGPWGARDGWPFEVGVRCDSCGKTAQSRLLFTMHGNEGLKDITTSENSTARIETMGAAELTMAELDAIERPGFVTHVFGDRDEARRIEAGMAAGELLPGRMMDADSARSVLSLTRYGRIIVRCHPRCRVQGLPIRRATLEAAFVSAVAGGRDEISLYDLRHHRRLGASAA